MMKNKSYTIAALLASILACTFLGQDAAAAGDDFGAVVKQIETEYHVHRNHRFLMAFAGFAVKVTSFSGVKGFKAAMFDDQSSFASASDARLDEVVRSAGKSGWQPLVRSFSRKTGERHYIYVQGHSKDLTLLMVNVEPGEAIVAQVRIDADKLNDFLNEEQAHHH